jgi:hypothetical protein
MKAGLPALRSFASPFFRCRQKWKRPIVCGVVSPDVETIFKICPCVSLANESTCFKVDACKRHMHMICPTKRSMLAVNWKMFASSNWYSQRHMNRW